MELTILYKIIVILKNTGKINNTQINDIMDFSLFDPGNIKQDFNSKQVINDFINFT